MTECFISTEHLNSVGPTFPLGLKEDCVYTERSFQLQPGHVLLLLTDGMTEAMNAQKELFGVDRLGECLKQTDPTGMSAHQIMNHVTDCVRRFGGDSAQHDDMMLVVTKVL